MIDQSGSYLVLTVQAHLARGVEEFTFGAVLAALAAALFAVGSVLQHDAAVSSVAGDGRLQFRQMLRNRGWLIGQISTVAGVGLQVAALAFAPVAIVQPLLAAELVIALLLRSWRTHRRPGGTEVAGAVLVAGGLTVFLIAARSMPGPAEHQPGTVATIAAVLIGVVLVALAALTPRGTVGALVCGVTAGMAAGLAAVLISAAFKVISTDGLLHAIAGPEIWGAIVLAIASQIGAQQAFSRGALNWSLPAQTLLDPVTAVPAALLLLGERLEPGHAAVWLPAAAIAALGIALLARTGDDDEPAPAKSAGSVKGG